jgi:hypothetical protein
MAKTKHCVMCAEEIPEKAKICKHCDSYQGGWFRLGISSTILSLLVALFAVLGVVVPIVKEAITEKNSNLEASFQGSASGADFGVLVTNTGARPGTVQAIARIKPASADFVYQAISLSGQSEIVEPEKSKLIVFKINGQLDPKFRDDACEVQISTHSFVGAELKMKIPTNAKCLTLTPPRYQTPAR